MQDHTLDSSHASNIRKSLKIIVFDAWESFIDEGF